MDGWTGETSTVWIDGILSCREAALSHIEGGSGPLRWLLQRRPPPRVVRRVLDAYRDEIFARGGRGRLAGGQTALAQACALRAPHEVIRLILECDAAAASVRDETANREVPLHAPLGDERTVRMIVEAHPRAVGMRDRFGGIPLHNAALSHASTVGSLNVLIEWGRRLDVGGGGCGGTLVENFHGRTPLSLACDVALSGVESGDDGMPRPLVGGYRLENWEKLSAVVEAAFRSTPEVARGAAATAGDPRPTRRPFRLLHCVIELDCPQLVVLQALVMAPGGAREKDPRGDLPLHLATKRKRPSRKVIKGLLNPDHGFPAGASVMGADGRLPLHLASERGMGLDDGLELLFVAAPRAINTRDLVTHMYPFMLAASGENSSLDVVYELLRKAPCTVKGLSFKVAQE